MSLNWFPSFSAALKERNRMNKQKEMTARNTSVGADDRQSLHVSINSIAAYYLKINLFVVKGGGRNG